MHRGQNGKTNPCGTDAQRRPRDQRVHILRTSRSAEEASVDVKGGGDRFSISSAVSFFKELGYTRFECRMEPEPAIKAHVDAIIKCLSDDHTVEQIRQKRQFPRVMRVWVRWRAGPISCKDKFKLCDLTSKNDLSQLSVLLIATCLGL